MNGELSDFSDARDVQSPQNLDGLSDESGGGVDSVADNGKISRTENPLSRRWGQLRQTLRDSAVARMSLSAGVKLVSGAALIAGGTPTGLSVLISDGGGELSDATFAYGLRAAFAKIFADDPIKMKRARIGCALGTASTALFFNGAEMVHSIMAPAHADGLAVGVSLGFVAFTAAIAKINSFGKDQSGIGHDGRWMALADFANAPIAAGCTIAAMTYPVADTVGSAAALASQGLAAGLAIRDALRES